MTKGPPQTKDLGKTLPTIVWDGLGLFQEHSGVGSYASNLYKFLARESVYPKVTSFRGDRLSYCESNNLIEIEAGKASSLQRKISNLKPIFPIKSYQAASRVSERMIYHGLSNINLPTIGLKRPQDRFVITIHDIIPLLLKNKSALAMQMHILLPKVVTRADWIITGSEWTKNLVLEQFGSKVENKISAVGYGVDTSSVVTSVTKHYDAVMVSRGESYKRLEVFKEISQNCPNQKFVLVTDQTGIKIIGEHPKNLVIKTKIPNEELANTILSSKIMIHPALYEGWCLPVADAIGYGLDILYCSGSGIDEVCAFSKNRVVKMQANDLVTQWIEAFKAMNQDETSERRESILPKWSEIASNTLKIYQTLV